MSRTRENSSGDESQAASRPNRKWAMPFLVLCGAAVTAGSVLMLSAPSATTPAAPVQRVELVDSFPHDRSSFSQGFVFHNGGLLEGTGKYGQSRLRLVDVKTGQPTVDIALPNDIFGEGVTVFGNTIVQLTWRKGLLITWDAKSFQQTGSVEYRRIDRTLREGWGITHDGAHLIISDGSDTLRFVDPKTWRVKRRLRVKDGFRGVRQLNELEFVNGEILANVWYQDRIARIDPQSGKVKAWLDLSHLRPDSVRRDREAVLNGIAWDAEGKRLFVTGKNWPHVFQVTF